MIKVAINGYGTVGKRVADAVSAQKDMKIVGVSKRTPDFSARIGSEKYSLFVPKANHLFQNVHKHLFYDKLVVLIVVQIKSELVLEENVF